VDLPAIPGFDAALPLSAGAVIYLAFYQIGQASKREAESAGKHSEEAVEREKRHSEEIAKLNNLRIEEKDQYARELAQVYADANTRSDKVLATLLSAMPKQAGKGKSK
jgi:ferritin